MVRFRQVSLYSMKLMYFSSHNVCLYFFQRGVVVEHSSTDYVKFQVHVTINETIFCLWQTNGGKSVTKAIHISIKHSKYVIYCEVFEIREFQFSWF